MDYIYTLCLTTHRVMLVSHIQAILHGIGAATAVLNFFLQFSPFSVFIIGSRTCLKYSPYTMGWRRNTMKMMFGLTALSTFAIIWGFHNNPNRCNSSTYTIVMEELPNKTTANVIAGFRSFLILVCVFFNTATWLFTPNNLLSCCICLRIL